MRCSCQGLQHQCGHDISLSAAKSVSTAPSSLPGTSAVLQTARRRRRLRQPYSSVTPLKSKQPKIEKGAEVIRNDKSKTANVSLTEAMKFEKAQAM